MNKTIFHIDIFLNTESIVKYILEKEEFIEGVEEDIGISIEDFLKMCKNFYTDKFTQKIFLKFLNNTIGCIV